MNLNATHEYRRSSVPVWMRWVPLAILIVSLSAGVASIYVRFAQLHHLAETSYHPYLSRVGISDNFYVWYFISFECLLILTFAITGGIVALHRSATWMTLFAAIALMLFGVTIPPPMHSLVVDAGAMDVSLRLVRSIGLALFVIFFYIFPDGRFVPRWTGILAIILASWSLVWPFYPPLDPYRWPRPFPFLILLAWFGTGVFAQVYRYVHFSSPVERQQSKWVVFGLIAAVLGDFLTHSPWYLFPSLQEGPDWLFKLVHHPFFVLSQLFVPITIGVSILRYGLWDIDPLINWTLVYGLSTAAVAAVWTASTKLLEVIFGQFIGSGTQPFAAGLSVFVVTIAFNPTRKRLENLIDRYFHPQKVDFSKALIEFLPQALASSNLLELLQALISRTTEIMHITYGAVFLYEADKTLQLAAAHNLTSEVPSSLALNNNLLNSLRKGKLIDCTEDSSFLLLVPLIQSQGKNPELIGVLALGPRTDGRGYSRSEQSALKTLAPQAGTAIYMARLSKKNQKELQEQITTLSDRIKTLEAQLDAQVKRIPD